MPKPWYIDVLAVGLVLVWMAWTYSTIQMYGPSLALIGGAVVFAAVGLLTVYGQRLRYLRLGNAVEIGMRTPDDYARDEESEDALLEREK